ncbi:unnamed protein product [Hermetia illucens]|uniref:Chitin-binding type-2 domain-containing protein n=1 Tax=Hermetia illucens TaxID=343691 RepID=A0A7R8YS60_HERIL|nr:uncharacterized protein LOC119648783 [Hermetia illucens]CAD7082230.1 unnamed protein product [Hermetia illucens]
MKLILVILCCTLGTGYAQGVPCDLTTPGAYSGVICVSKTQFVFPDTAGSTTDPSSTTPQTLDATTDATTTPEPLECPEGLVCADVPEICTSAQEPLCKNTVAGQGGSCNECLDDNASKVCISETEYSVCNRGSVIAILKYTCPTDKRFCKTVEGVADCQTDSADLDCAGATNSTTGGEGGNNGGTGGTPGETTCTSNGLFPDTTDPNCTKYYKCTEVEPGKYNTIHLQCLNAGFGFNPTTKLCERDYVCTNTAQG